MLIYLIKFIYSFLLPPGCFVLLLLFLGIRYYRRTCKLALGSISLALVLWIFSTPFLSDRLIGSLEQRYQLPATVNGDVIILLGGGSTANTPDFGGTGHLSGSSANRTLTAIRLMLYYDLPLLYSGGRVHATNGDEAVIVRRILSCFGINEQRLFTETQSLNTTQSGVKIKELLEVQGWRRPILVTSAFHMERSVQIFRNLGIEVVAVPTDYKVSRAVPISWMRLAPSASGLLNTAITIREYLGIAALYTKYTDI